MNVREEMVEVIATELARQSGIGDQANSVGDYYRALADEIVTELSRFFRDPTHGAKRLEAIAGKRAA